MSEINKSPSEQSTRPEGNTSTRPSVLERGIGANVAAKMRELNPPATKAVRDMVERKRTESGHARD